MRLHLWVALLLASMLTSCGAARVVRLETGQGRPAAFTPRPDSIQPVELGKEEFQEALARVPRGVRPPADPQAAARHLFQSAAGGGSYLVNPRTRQVTPVEGGALAAATDAEITRLYLQWCERTGRPGDCLHLLVKRPTLDREGRFVLALALAQGAVLEEMFEAFKDMANPHAMVAAALWTGTLYMILWSLPEPVSKGVGAVMTATLIVYLGVDTFWGLMTGFRRLMDEADHAQTFDQLRKAGERYGKVMGRNAARAFALLATVAVGNTAAGFASKVPTLPGSAVAATQAGPGLGISLAAVGEVEAVAITSGAISIELAPGAVSSTVAGLGGTALSPVDAEGHDHHIATDKWWDSLNNGGPWSPRFQRIFDKAGMSLNDPANIVRVIGHRGPHPKEYHIRVYERLSEATKRCSTMQQCREALTAELKRLAKEIATPGSPLNKLVTRTP